MAFVCIWFSFAVALYWLNFHNSRKVYEGIPYWECGRRHPGILLDIDLSWVRACEKALWRSISGDQHSNDSIRPTTIADDIELETSSPPPSAPDTAEMRVLLIFNWKAVLLLFTGFLGGVFTSIGGSGLDISSFAVLTLFFCVSERVSTPTSIILMAANSIVAFIWRALVQNAIDPESWRMWLCCVPIVCFGAPLGSLLMTRWHRLVIAALVVFTDVSQLGGALYVVRPWSSAHTTEPLYLCLFSFFVLMGCTTGFFALSSGGTRLLSTFKLLPKELQNSEEEKHGETHTQQEVGPEPSRRTTKTSTHRWVWYDRSRLNHLDVLNNVEVEL